MEKIDAKYLEGLAYTGSKPVEQKLEGGGKKTLYIPFSRQATQNDVLSWKDQGDTVVVVLNDGKKYNVKKDGSSAGGEQRMNAKDTIASVMKITNIDELKKLKKTEDRKGVLEAIDAQIESLKG